MTKVAYESGTGTLVDGWIAEEAESPLTGKLRFRVVDFVSEASDPEAGKWVYASDCIDMSGPAVTGNPAN